MNDVSFARMRGAFDIARVPLLALVGMSRPGRTCGISRGPRTVRQLVGLVAMTLVVNATGAGAQSPVEPSSNVGAAVGMAVHRLQDMAFVLEDAEHGSTRLLVRVRVRPGARIVGLPWSVTNYFVSAIHFVMQRKQLIGIARRVEHAGHVKTRGPEERQDAA